MSQKCSRCAAPQREQTDPDVSIIVACFNAAATVSATLASLTAQTHENWEAICVDDGSTDRTPELLDAATRADARIRMLLVEHVGQPAAKNRGVEAARAPQIMILDADDVARPDALAVMLEASRATGGKCIVAPGTELLDRQGRPLALFRFPVIPDFSVDTLLRGNRLPPMSLVPRAALGPQMFDESPPTCIDWGVWLRLANAGVECVTVPRVLFGYRLHGQSLSHNADRMFASGRQLLERWLPCAREPHAVRDVVHRLACLYGAVALAGGDHAALARYFATLPPLEPAYDFCRAVAADVHGAFVFVRGAANQRWRDYANEWSMEIEAWLYAGPLAAYAPEILECLSRVAPDPRERASAAINFIRTRPDAQRVVIHGLGNNGLPLIEQLRNDAELNGRALLAADDHASSTTFSLLGLPREDPRQWRNWPAGTVVIVTPNDCDGMCAALTRAGGREGVDHIALARCAALNGALAVGAQQT